MRVFVIWDPATLTVRTMLEALPELEPEDGDPEIEWEIPFLSRGGREIGRDMLLRGLKEADHIIALLDQCSASVGWQMGLAFGWGKSMQLAYCGTTLPTWTQVSPLKGLFARPVRDISEVKKLLAPLRWEFPAAAAVTRRTRLLLCPTGPTGSTLRAVAAAPDLEVLPEDGWGLYDLPRLLAEPEQVIWILAPDLAGGDSNAANAVVAGFAEAQGRSVAVLRAAEYPAVADVQTRELGFHSVEEFRRKLAQTERRHPTAPAVAAGRAQTRRRPQSDTETDEPLPRSPQRRSAFPLFAVLSMVLLLGALGGLGAGIAWWRVALRTEPSKIAPPVPPPPIAVIQPKAAAPLPAKPVPKGSPGVQRQVAEPDAVFSAPSSSPTAPDASASPVAPVPGPVAARRSISCPQLTDAALQRLLTDAAAAWNREHKSTFEQALKGRCLTARQLAGGLLTIMPPDRLGVLRRLSKRILDPDQIAELLPLFFKNEYGEVRKLLSSP